MLATSRGGNLVSPITHELINRLVASRRLLRYDMKTNPFQQGNTHTNIISAKICVHECVCVVTPSCRKVPTEPLWLKEMEIVYTLGKNNVYFYTEKIHVCRGNCEKPKFTWAWGGYPLTLGIA